MATSIPSGGHALLEQAHGVVEVGEEQRVDDEAGLVLHLDRLLAAGQGEVGDGALIVSSLASGAARPRPASWRAGLKKCMPHTRSGCEMAIASSMTESVEVLVASTVSGFMTRSSSAKTALLHLDVLDHRSR
jgi:hypothetical protein